MLCLALFLAQRNMTQTRILKKCLKMIKLIELFIAENLSLFVSLKTNSSLWPAPNRTKTTYSFIKLIKMLLLSGTNCSAFIMPVFFPVTTTTRSVIYSQLENGHTKEKQPKKDTIKRRPTKLPQNSKCVVDASFSKRLCKILVNDNSVAIKAGAATPPQHTHEKWTQIKFNGTSFGI